MLPDVGVVFYPREPDAPAGLPDGVLAGAPADLVFPKALIVPYAGHRFSGGGEKFQRAHDLDPLRAHFLLFGWLGGSMVPFGGDCARWSPPTAFRVRKPY
jgi:hypothetical protein